MALAAVCLFALGAVAGRPATLRASIVMSTTQTQRATTGPSDVSKQAPRVTNAPPFTPLQTAQAFYSAWNHGDYDAAADLLAPDVKFRDINYPQPFYGRERVRTYLKECTENLVGWQFFIDDYAEDIQRGRLGLRWHVNDPDGNPLLLPSGGISFLRMTDDMSQIAECTDINEPFSKIPLPVQGPMLQVGAEAMKTARGAFKTIFGDDGGPLKMPAPVNEPPYTAIKTARIFYDAWNAGDADAAAAVMSSDVLFRDMNFEGGFEGRVAVRDFLAATAEILGDLNFVIDDWAEDSARRSLGLKWHVQDSQGRRIPVASQGTSFLRFNEYLNEIVEVTDHGEPLATPPEQLQMPLAMIASRALEFRRTGKLPEIQLPRPPTPPQAE